MTTVTTMPQINNMIGRTEWGKLSSAARAARFFIQFFDEVCHTTTWNFILGSLSNHDDDGNKNPTNLHIWQRKTVFLHALHVTAYFIIWPFEDVLVLSTTWNDLFCSCVDDVSIWWQTLIFVFLCPKRWFQFNSRIVRSHFASAMILNNCDIIEETRSYLFRWRSRCRRRRVCLSSLILPLKRR